MQPSSLRACLRSVSLGLVRLGFLPLREFSAGMGLDEIKAEYQETLYQAMADYLESERSIVAFRNSCRKAVNDSFTLAFIAGFADAGGASEELPEEDRAWLISRIEDEIAFADGLFQDLKALRADTEKSQDDRLAFASAKSAGYVAALDGIYSQGKMRGDLEQAITLEGDDGKESCQTCQKYKGETHPASWWVERGLVLYPGNTNFDCGAWACAHVQVDKEGNVWAAGGGY